MNSVIRVALIIGLLTVIIFSLYSLLSTVEDGDYAEAINTERAEKDIWLSNDFNSPFAVTNTPFQRLSYYEPSYDFRVKAKFIKAVSKDSVVLVTNTGESQLY